MVDRAGELRFSGTNGSTPFGWPSGHSSPDSSLARSASAWCCSTRAGSANPLSRYILDWYGLVAAGRRVPVLVDRKVGGSNPPHPSRVVAQLVEHSKGFGPVPGPTSRPQHRPSLVVPPVPTVADRAGAARSSSTSARQTGVCERPTSSRSRRSGLTTRPIHQRSPIVFSHRSTLTHHERSASS